jgi:hypothetical protein
MMVRRVSLSFIVSPRLHVGGRHGCTLRISYESGRIGGKPLHEMRTFLRQRSPALGLIR